MAFKIIKFDDAIRRSGEKIMVSRYSTIAIKPQVHDDIKKLAKHSYQTVGGYIEKLIEKENETNEMGER